MRRYRHLTKEIILLFVLTSSLCVYGQREISFDEPMYTKDFAEKHHLTLGIQVLTEVNHWFIENFKAPEGVKIIVENSPSNSFPCFRTFYIYDTNSKYLNREISHSVDKNGIIVPNSMIGALYEYDFQKDKIEIKKKDLNNPRTLTTFVFDTHNENLLEQIIKKGDTIRYYYSDTIVPKKFIVNRLQISSLENKINYEVTIYDDEFIYEEQPFIHFDRFTSNRSPFTLLGGLNKRPRLARIQAKEFNSFIKKYALLDEDQKKLNVKFSIQLAEEKLDVLLRNHSELVAHDLQTISRSGNYDIWITKHTVTSKSKEGGISLLFDSKTKRVSKKSDYFFKRLGRYTKQSTYIYKNEY